MSQLRFKQSGQTFEITIGTELKRACELNPTIPIKFGCRQGECGTCAIRVEKGEDHLSRLTKIETETLRKKSLPPGYRLACQCALLGDVTIE